MLEGIVTDLNGSRVITARIVVSGQAFSKTVKTNGEGVYKTDLPVGSFRITAFAFGFCPGRRAPIEVSPDGKSNTINFTMIECAIGRRIPTNGLGDDLGDEYRFPFNEQVFSLTGKNVSFDFLA